MLQNVDKGRIDIGKLGKKTYTNCISYLDSTNVNFDHFFTLVTYFEAGCVNIEYWLAPKTKPP